MVTSRIITGFALALVVLGIGLGACVARADAGHASATTCQADPQPKVVSDARAALAGSPNDLAAQLALIDALIDQGCYRQAVPVLETSLAQRPRSSELQSRMRAVRSMLNEEQFFEGLGTAQETAKFQHDLMRCAKFFDVNACDDALRSKPDDPQIVIAKGDALAHEGRPADAILIYLHAGGLLPPADEAIKMKLSAAEAQREGLAAQCQVSADAAAADACQAALLRGSADEFALLKRRGILLQSFDKPEQALDAFIAASVLKQDDKAVALAVVALTDSTGRKDAMALQARGAALLLLNRPTEALQALRQAEALAPTLQGIKAQVAKAEQGSKEEGKRQARLATVQPGSGQSGAGAAAPAPVAAQ
jgi:tetratricopeptide (TPR) repeat protein